MKKLLIFSFILLFTQAIHSQEVLPLSNIDDLQKLMESKRGKVLLVNFWATWCVPCVKEFPELMKLYNDYKDNGLEVVFISTDMPEDLDGKVKPFLKKNGAEFITYYSNFDNVEELINYFDKNWGGGIPSTYIFSKEGKLTASLQGRKEYSEFENEIKKGLD